MRGHVPSQPSFVSLINVETLIAADQPIRPIKRICDEVLRAMSGPFDEIYAADGAPSIPPETLLKGKVLQALYTVRSERQLCARLLAHEVADLLFAEVVEVARRHGWVSNDHFSVDATLVEAWAALKSFKPKGTDRGTGGGNSWTDFNGEKRGNATHESTTDAEAKLVRKGPGKEARLCFAGHATMENRHGLCVLFEVQPAVGAPESQVAAGQAVESRDRGFKPETNGGDIGDHTAEFVTGMRELRIVPHPALEAGQKTLRVVCTAAHAVSQKVRKRTEEILGWTKTTGGFRKSRYRSVERTHAHGQSVVATWNLVRMAKLMVSGPPQTARA